jgi:hypothetical protein
MRSVANLSSASAISETHDAELGTVEEVDVDGGKTTSPLPPSGRLNRFDDDGTRRKEEDIRLASPDASEKLSVRTQSHAPAIEVSNGHGCRSGQSGHLEAGRVTPVNSNGVFAHRDSSVPVRVDKSGDQLVAANSKRSEPNSSSWLNHANPLVIDTKDKGHLIRIDYIQEAFRSIVMRMSW